MAGLSNDVICFVLEYYHSSEIHGLYLFPKKK